nr:hypothetical protein CFP56_22060 [Quercus suber]
MRAPPFVAARRSTILVPGFYAEKKKKFSGTPGDIDSGRSSDSGDGIIREDSVNQNRFNEIIIETPKETEIAEKMSNVELSLAQEFGAAKLLETSSNVSKNPKARDNLSEPPTLNKSRAAKENKVQGSSAPRASAT